MIVADLVRLGVDIPDEVVDMALFSPFFLT